MEIRGKMGEGGELGNGKFRNRVERVGVNEKKNGMVLFWYEIRSRPELFFFPSGKSPTYFPKPGESRNPQNSKRDRKKKIFGRTFFTHNDRKYWMKYLEIFRTKGGGGQGDGLPPISYPPPPFYP